MTASAPADLPGPLHGIRVVDLTGMLAGPYATMLLADLGADVVKIEPPAGDVTRRASPVREGDGPGALSGYFQSVNRGKRSIALDLKDLPQKERLLQLIDRADVVVESYSAHVMDRLGLSYEILAARNPRLVYAALRGFGDRRTGPSPLADWPAYDVVAQAMGGLLSITGTEDGGPVKTGPGVGDIFPASLLAVGILAALYDARRTGKGQFVDVAMYDAVLSLCERIVHQYSYTGVSPVPQGNAHPMLSPFDILPTKDGWVALAAPHDHQWQVLTGLIGRPGLADDPDFQTGPARVRNKHRVRAALLEWLRGQPTEEVVRLLGGQVAIGPVNTAGDIFRDPHVAAREMLVTVEQPGSTRPVTIAGSPIKLTRTPSAVRRRGPLLGEDDIDDVLTSWADVKPGGRDGTR